MAGSVSRLVRSKPTQQERAACAPLPSGPAGRKELVDGFFLDGAVAIPHDIETLDGSSQALAVQGVAGDFLGLAMVAGWLTAETSYSWMSPKSSQTAATQ